MDYILLVIGFVLSLTGLVSSWLFLRPQLITIYLYDEMTYSELYEEYLMSKEVYEYLQLFPNASADTINQIMWERQKQEQIENWKKQHPGQNYRGLWVVKKGGNIPPWTEKPF